MCPFSFISATADTRSYSSVVEHDGGFYLLSPFFQINPYCHFSKPVTKSWVRFPVGSLAPNDKQWVKKRRKKMKKSKGRSIDTKLTGIMSILTTFMIIMCVLNCSAWLEI